MMGLASRMFCLCTFKFKSQSIVLIFQLFLLLLVIVANDDLNSDDFFNLDWSDMIIKIYMHNTYRK